MSLVPSMGLIGQYFSVRFAFVNGLVYAGTGLGIVALTPLAQYFQDTYGWRGVLLLFGAVCLHVVIIGTVLRKPPAMDEEKQTVTTPLVERELESTNSTTERPLRRYGDCFNKCVTAFHTFQEIFGFKLFTNKLFVVTVTCMVIFRFVFDGWILFYIPTMENKGIGPNLSVSIAAIAGFCNLITRATHGLLISFGLLTAEQLYLISASLMALSLILVPFLQSYGPNFAAGLLFGVASGVCLPLGNVLLKQSVKPSEFVSSVSLSYCLSAFAKLSAGYIIGIYTAYYFFSIPNICQL